MAALRIVQYFELLAFTGSSLAAQQLDGINQRDTVTLANLQQGTVFHRYQNYFVNETVSFGGQSYGFAPFQVEGTISTLGGDNGMVQVLFPNIEIVLRLVQQGNGNRLSRLKLTTVWLNEALRPTKSYEEYYIGIGAAFSETTVELRFRSAMDSVGSQFPARKLSRNLVGLLPLSADIRLQ